MTRFNELQGGTTTIITGTMAAGKSTIAELLAKAFPYSVCLHGDEYRVAIVNGREEYLPKPSREATKQLNLRYAIASQVCNSYAEAGFNVVVEDILLEDDLRRFLSALTAKHVYLVGLVPGRATIQSRVGQREDDSYGNWSIAEMVDSVEASVSVGGLWIDNSALNEAETVTEIESNFDSAKVR